MTLPKNMKAIDIREPGGPEVLVPIECNLPALGDNDVLIKNSAVGVNRPDVAQRTGNYPVPPDASSLPGLEVAGEVVDIGKNVSKWSIGDSVTALTHGGGYAEYTAVNEGHCLVWPNGFDANHSAAIPETYFTVQYNIFMRAGLASGERILIHGGSSGIGHAAIQLSKAKGAEVIVTAGSDEKCSFCETSGANKAINYREEDWVKIVKDYTDNQGVDVVLDIVAGDYVNRNLDVLTRDGRYAALALLGGANAEINMGRILRKRLTLLGSTLRPQTTEEKTAIADNLRSEVWPLMNAGQVKPNIYQAFPLEKASEAHQLMESSIHMGKIILTLDN